MGSSSSTPVAEGNAFGLTLSADFAVPGLPPESGPRLPRVRLTRVRRQELGGPWPAGTTVLSDRRRPDGRVVQRVATHPDRGHLLESLGWGCYEIAPGAGLVRCAPVRMPTWRWQRYLVGQVLPFLAVLHGYEVFHASVVQRHGRAIALSGASGSGKSTLAAALLQRGWELVADDVLVARNEGDEVLAHPGTGLLNVRTDAAARLRPLPGRPIGHDEESVRLAVPVTARPVPLDAFLVVRRGDGAELVGCSPVDPALLLGCSFNFVVQTPDRLVRQLDVCHRLATRVPVTAVTVRPGVEPHDLAARIEAHALAGAAA